MQNSEAAAYKLKKSSETRETPTGVRNKIKRIMFMTALTFLVSSVPLAGSSMAGAVAMTACTASASRRNLYLMLPSALGMMLQIRHGIDGYSDLAAMVISGIFFASAANIRFKPVHKAVITACISIICTSIYRLASVTLYKIDPQTLICEGLMVFALIFIFSNFLQSAAVLYSIGSPEKGREEQDTMLSLTAFSAVSVMIFCGTGLDFMVWAFVVFISLWALAYTGAEQSLTVTFASGMMAALAGQTQWGILVSLMAGTAAASLIDGISGLRFRRFMQNRSNRHNRISDGCEDDDTSEEIQNQGNGRQDFARKKNYRWLETRQIIRIIILTTIYVMTCTALKYPDSGVVLGVDAYTLMTAAAAFLALSWKAGDRMQRIITTFASGSEQSRGHGAASREAQQQLRCGEDEMAALDELYSTYLDSRSMLANQFELTRQILEKTRLRLHAKSGLSGTNDGDRYRFETEIAVSQCAALGGINGDCCGWQDIGDGRMAIVLSDGMGKGKKAASESLMVVRTVLSLLRAGVSAETVLKTINSVMLMKDDGDSFATLDLVIADRKNGRGTFYKIGAAPTLLRRKDHIEKMKLPAVPLGIVNGLKVRYMEASLRRGDWIIMMSDGVSDGGTNHSMVGDLSETAVKIRSDNPQVMSDLILDQAADSYALRERDDMTVIAVKLK